MTAFWMLMQIANSEKPLLEDLTVFLAVLHHHSFIKTAAALGVSTAYVSKRIKILENTLKTKLFHRNTRRLVLTDEGLKLQDFAVKLEADMDELLFQMALAKSEISGNINICASFGFGGNIVTKAISELVNQHPKIKVNLHLTDQEVDLVNSGFHLEIKVDNQINNQDIARQLATNYRILCASPSYLKKNGIPKHLQDLQNHHCLFIQEKKSSLGTWHLEGKKGKETVTFQSSLTSNSGNVVLQWSLDGHGIILRSIWEVQQYIDAGSLVRILPNYIQSANIWAVYPNKLSQSAKLKICVDFFAEYFEKHGVISFY
ncbi:LysR substrate-binding domain-containing protein [Entomomonas moraniae]|nr:LysR substrate-binding domain-containing protein [Entomomonas moraniae]